jgi:hypothetical protein
LILFVCSLFCFTHRYRDPNYVFYQLLKPEEINTERPMLIAIDTEFVALSRVCLHDYKKRKVIISGVTDAIHCGNRRRQRLEVMVQNRCYVRQE